MNNYIGIIAFFLLPRPCRWFQTALHPGPDDLAGKVSEWTVPTPSSRAILRSRQTGVYLAVMAEQDPRSIRRRELKEGTFRGHRPHGLLEQDGIVWRRAWQGTIGNTIPRPERWSNTRPIRGRRPQT